MASVTIAELVRNGTMSAEMAAVLWAAADEQQSFLTAAIPRLAGKTTTSNAVLALCAPEVAVTPVAGEPEIMLRLAEERRGGYLVVAEFAQSSMPDYIWGEPVQRVFETVHQAGYALQASLHAPSVDAAVQQVTQGNGIDDAHASVLKFVIYIERFGSSEDDYWRRVTDLYEIERVENGRPVGRSLFQWREAGDRFEQLAEPTQWGRNSANLTRRAAVVGRLAENGQTSAAEVTAAVAQYRSSRS